MENNTPGADTNISEESEDKICRQADEVIEDTDTTEKAMDSSENMKKVLAICPKCNGMQRDITFKFHCVTLMTL